MKINLVADAVGRGKILIDGKDVTDNVKAVNIRVTAGHLTEVDVTYSDVQVQAAVEYAGLNCSVERQEDEMVCAECGLRWGATEDKPDCPQGRLEL